MRNLCPYTSTPSGRGKDPKLYFSLLYFEINENKVDTLEPSFLVCFTNQNRLFAHQNEI